MLWGGTFIAGRVAAVEMAAPTAALWRYVIATVILVAASFAFEHGLPRLSRAQWVGVSLLGLTGVAISNLCFMFGMQTVPASRGSLIIATVPAATLLGGALFLHESLTLRRVAGVMIALLGVAIELGHGNPLVLFDGHAGIGEAALFGGVIAWAAYTLIGKRLLADMSPLAATTYAALTGTAMLGAVCLLKGGVRTIGPARSMVFVNLVPIFAIALAMLLLGERIELSMVVGAVFVIAGVFIINRPEHLPAVAHVSAVR